MTLIEATYYTTSISVNTESLFSQALVAHVCNPSYLRGREQEDHSSKPARANSSRDPILKNPTRKRADEVAQGIGPEFKPQYHKKKKRERESVHGFMAAAAMSTSDVRHSEVCKGLRLCFPCSSPLGDQEPWWSRAWL
jgi:hypothetical protein